jgi:hypothetical protein
MDARPKKPDAHKDLTDLLDHLTLLAHEAAAAPTEHQWDLLIDELLLRASTATEMQIASDYERMMIWLADVLPRLSAADRAANRRLAFEHPARPQRRSEGRCPAAGRDGRGCRRLRVGRGRQVLSRWLIPAELINKQAKIFMVDEDEGREFDPELFAKALEARFGHLRRKGGE